MNESGRTSGKIGVRQNDLIGVEEGAGDEEHAGDYHQTREHRIVPQERYTQYRRRRSTITHHSPTPPCI